MNKKDNDIAAFKKNLTARVLWSMQNCLYDNHRDYLFKGKEELVRDAFDFHLKKNVNFDAIINRLEKTSQLNYYLYHRLKDEQSREALLQISSYIILGNNYVRLPNYSPYITERIKHLVKKCRFVNDEGIAYYDFAPIGYPVKIQCSKEILYTFAFDQPYHYKNGLTYINVEKGDTVIECGAGDGLTTLIFSSLASGVAGGRVVAFEPSTRCRNKIFEHLQLNTGLAENIMIMECGAWDQDDITLDLSYEHNSPTVMDGCGTEQIKIRTIDSVVDQLKLTAVNFLKMDIEGAEYNALLGARETIAKYRPKLAISIYHISPLTNDRIDFLRIPELIDSYNLGYNFFLSHHGFTSAETILYCIAN